MVVVRVVVMVVVVVCVCGGGGGAGWGGIPNATLSPPERFFVKMGVAGSDILIRHVL